MSQIDTDLRMRLDDDGSVAVVHLSGELDASTAPELRNCLAELFLAGRRRVVLDMAELDFIDSTGLGVIVAALKRFDADGGAVVAQSPKHRVRKVFELTKLDTVFLVA